MIHSEEAFFQHRLALALGFPSVDELLSRMTSREYLRWWIYDQMEPIGSPGVDQQHAFDRQLVANMNRSKGKRPYKIEEFMLWRREPRKAEPKNGSMTQDQLMAAVLRANTLLGGKDLRKK